jgi:Holliday junction resolvase RusA-like endonuclease
MNGLITTRIAGRLLFTLDMEPIGKGSVRVVRTARGKSRSYLPTKTDDWLDAAAVAIALARRRQRHERCFGPVAVTIHAVLSRPQRLLRKKDPDGRLWRPHMPDPDNVAKAVLDACSRALVWKDDKQVVDLRVLSLYARKGERGCVEVTICPTSSDPHPDLAIMPMPPSEER